MNVPTALSPPNRQRERSFHFFSATSTFHMEEDCDIYNFCLSLRDKRCMSMPSVTSSSPSSTTSSRSRLLRLQDRRFHHKFPDIHPDERLVNYYSCALLADILLQGHLFITENFIAFYSNIFGHKTEILIPVLDVVKVTKERTAKIIPNAVGVYTENDKYIFGSLLSRDTTYRLIHQIWIKSTDAGLGLPDDSESEVSPVLVNGTDDDSVSGVSGQLTSDDVSLGTSEAPVETTPEVMSTNLLHSLCRSQDVVSLTDHVPHFTTRCRFGSARECLVRVEEAMNTLSKLPRTSLLLMMSTVLLVVLFLSASVLLYRINMVHRRLSTTESWYPDSTSKFSHSSQNNPDDQEVEVSKLVKSLQDRIRHLSQIRQTLEELLVTASKLHNVCKTPVTVPVTSKVHRQAARMVTLPAS